MSLSPAIMADDPPPLDAQGMPSLMFSLQALLVRHEAYIADSEKERQSMNAHIESLENEKKMLEERNATVIEENRDLLDQLESLNSAVAESDTQVTNLQATLRTTQQELHKLSGLAARTEHLEQQLAEFEREQATWQTTVDEKEGAEKSALRRWQHAERTLTNLHEQMERIEREAKEERERHVEVLQRMERRHAVENELGSAAGRLKGAASAKDSNGTTVVSHFVKDILQDNANLQMGIVELRDMLQSSNEEVESLRAQLSVHQPLVEDSAAEVMPVATRPHLSEEMRRATSQEVHVHHHYHAPSSTPKSTPLRKPRKKRYGSLTSGQYTPSSGRSTPQNYPPSTPSNTAAILSQTSASLPDGAANVKRWSMQSMQSYQSYQSMQLYSDPSSPISTNRSSSMFDRVFSDAGQDSSRPTTPDTEEPGTPVLAPTSSKRSSVGSYSALRNPSYHRNRPSLDSILDISTENLRQIEQQHASEAAIPEEDELAWENASSSRDDPYSSAISPLSEELEAFEHRPLRRATSHESILSFSGMDIHTLRNRPSQLLTSVGTRSFAPQAVVSGATAHARPAAMSRSTTSGLSLLSGMTPPAQRPTGPKQGIGSKVGGWVFGRWGASPTPPASSTATQSTPKINRSVSAGNNIPLPAPKMNRTPSVASGSTGKSANDPDATPKKPKLRAPGINQSGPIMGFFPEVKVQHAPVMKSLDQEALKSVLGE
jgi:myosin heavy subunit